MKRRTRASYPLDPVDQGVQQRERENADQDRDDVHVVDPGAA